MSLLGRRFPMVKCRFGIKEPRGRTTVCLRNVPNNYTRCLAKMSPKALKFVARGQMFYLNLWGVSYKHLKARKKNNTKRVELATCRYFLEGLEIIFSAKKMPTRCCYVLEKIFNPQRHTLARSPGAEESPKTRRIESVQWIQTKCGHPLDGILPEPSPCGGQFWWVMSHGVCLFSGFRTTLWNKRRVK